MAGGKETPRQKMIGMMYLVLTALLALNVSKEILDAFITINGGLETTKATFEGKLGSQYAGFAASYNENPEKYGEAYQKAQSLQQQANDLVAHINLIKAKIQLLDCFAGFYCAPKGIGRVTPGTLTLPIPTPNILPVGEYTKCTI